MKTVAVGILGQIIIPNKNKLETQTLNKIITWLLNIIKYCITIKVLVITFV